MPEHAAPAISTADGAEVRPLTDGGLGFLREVCRMPHNASAAAALALDEDDFLTALRGEPWSTPMVLLQDGTPMGCALIGAADSRHLHGRLVVLAREPRGLGDVLALYLRQVFWSHPVHRLYAVQASRMAEVSGYSDLLRACGFVAEGRLVGHLRVGGRMVDLDLWGLLRSEFDAWCAVNRPAWALE